jgi:hypothetical protein
MPVTSARRGRALEVWGCARPARFAQIDTGDTQNVQIQFQRGSRGPFTPLREVTLSGSSCYFDVHMQFPGSGTVRLAWAYPTSDQLLGFLDPTLPHTTYSRVVRITVR